MPPPIPDALRRRIIIWSEEQKKPAEIAALAGCSIRSVYSILSYHRDYGTLNNPFARIIGCSRMLSIGDLNFVASVISARPKVFLDELQQELFTYRGVEVSIPTISRALQRWEISNKAVSSAALERNELLRATWQAEYGDIPEGGDDLS